MAGWFTNARAALAKRISPFNEIGVGGTAIYGGYVLQTDRKYNLQGSQRWTKATEIFSDISIVAASIRYRLNLLARPAWKAKPPSDKAEAKAAAEFVDSVIHGTDTSWSRIVRREGLFSYHGFGISEWVAKRRDDGRTGLASIERRPQHTIAKWDRDPNGTVIGVWQRDPQGGREIYLPREKIVYLVDDMLTDSPEGLGWFRHLVEPSAMMKRFLKLETIGFERDLSGIPIGRAPMAAINAMIGTKMIPDDKGGERLFTKADADELIQGLSDFVSMKSKDPETGLILDSQPFTAKVENGTTISSTLQWGLELLTGEPKSMEELGGAIRRLSFDMALIMGSESLLVGREGAGSLALSQDKTRSLALSINSATGDMAEAYDRDIIGPIWALNGLPDELRPKLEVEDAAFKDVEQMAKVLKDMADAGAIFMPDDPVFDDLRQLAGMPPAPKLPPELLGMVRPPKGKEGEVPDKGGNDPT